MHRRMAAALVVFICLFSLLAGLGKCVAYAEEESSEYALFGNLELLKQEDDNYVIQVTVTNKGEDFSGIVQLVFASSATENCAYNTEITLPAQGKKQFTVTVPERAVDTAKGLCAMNFLDEKGKLIQTVPFKNIFKNVSSSVPVGVLSDNYASLGYMDAGGMDFDIRGESHPLRLVELTQENMDVYLDGLYFLIIDQFNVSSLRQENIQAIQDWVKAGGWLIIGTGAYAEQTLSGFDEDFLNLSITEIREPGEENTIHTNARRYGYYYNYTEEDIDFTNMAIAELNFNNLMGDDYESAQNPAIINCSYGDGAVAVYFCSLGEKELRKLRDYDILYMYEEVMYQSNSYHIDGRTDMNYIGQRALASIDSANTDVDFSWLKVLITIYVVLVGPVLYLVLRKCKKSEWYWIGVPMLGLAFIVVVFIFGQGSRVTGTKVYSVTVQRTDSSKMDTYFLAYHSGTKPWEMRLRDDYEVGGAGWCGHYYGGYNTSDYTYFVTNDSQGMSIGMKPHENFESGYLYARGSAERKGSIIATDMQDKLYSIGKFDGTVTNDTGVDLDYMAVWFESHIMIYKNVKAGETLDLYRDADERCVYTYTSADDVNDLMYSMLFRYNNSKKEEYRQDDIAALLIGLGVAHGAQPADKDYALIVGVSEDYDKAVASKCSETAYGVLYTYVEMGVDLGAAN